MACTLALASACRPARRADVSDTVCDRATQGEMTACWGREASRNQKAATAVYERARVQLRASGAPEALRLLEESQAAWVHYRDLHCRGAAAVYEGGSLAPMIEAQCRAQLARSWSDRVRDSFVR